MKDFNAGYRRRMRHCPLLLLVGLMVLAGCASSARPAARTGDATPTPFQTVSARGGVSVSGLSAAQVLREEQQRKQTPEFLANVDISRMSLDEELGQLFIADFTGNDYNANNAAMVRDLHAGGIILYSRSVQTASQTRALIQSAQADAQIPLLTAVDEEGGYVDRLQSVYGARPSASAIGARGSTEYARSQGAQVAHDMSALGFNFDLAPDVDVQLVNGPDQLTRTFGSTPEQVTTLAGAYLSGLQQDGVFGCLKHFPGLGAAQIDAHAGLPLISRTRGQVESVELAPYRNLIATGQVHAIMTTDLLMPALDATMPAELSPATITGVLRDELHFNGVVVTDALYMAGISDRYGMPEAGVLSILAGDDLLEGPWTPDQMRAMMDALRQAISSGRLSKSRIDDSVRRILVMKMEMGLLPMPHAVG